MARAAKLFYFRWFPAEAELDEDWCLMSMAERGLYISLLNYSWLNDGLPADTEDMARAVRVGVEEFRSLWVKVGRKFFLHDGRLRNNRQEEERSAINTRSGKNADAANRRWERNANAYANADANAMLRAYNYNSNSVSNSSSSERESEGKPEPTQKELDEFLEWADAVYLRHPKQKNEFISKLALRDRFSQDPEARALFEKNHLLWIEYWKDEEANFVPALCTDKNAGFIPDSAWKKPPPRRIPRGGKQVDETKRKLEEKYGVKL